MRDESWRRASFYRGAPWAMRLDEHGEAPIPESSMYAPATLGGGVSGFEQVAEGGSPRLSSPRSSHQAPRGTPVDEFGICDATPDPHEDHKAAFDMLDRHCQGFLCRRDARSWFRCLGWCLNDETLDAILDGAASEQLGVASSVTGLGPSRSSTLGLHANGMPEHRGWRLKQLTRVSEHCRDLCGPDPDAIKRTVRMLSKESVRMAPPRRMRQDLLKAHCIQSTQGRGALTNAEFSELMEICSVPVTAKHVDRDELIQYIIDTICEPRAAHPRGWAAGSVGGATRFR